MSNVCKFHKLRNLQHKNNSQGQNTNPAQIKHSIRIAGVRQRPERNQLVLYLSHTACLRITEIAQICPKDLFTKSGHLRESFVLPVKYAKGKKNTRRIWLTHPKLRVAINTYSRFRAEHKIGLDIDAEYRGLAPKSAFIRNNRGAGYA